jgi:hypothetical protein
MMEEILKSLRSGREEMDSDVHSDFCFIMGDLNYRFDTTFEEMYSSNMIKTANKLLDQLD